MPDDPLHDGSDRPERRAPAAPKGSIPWMRSLLGRPLKLQPRPDGVGFSLLDRRRPPEVVRAESMARLREELRLRLIGLVRAHPTVAKHPLVEVDEVLGRKGWAGVQNLKSAVLRMAGVQLKVLLRRKPSIRLERFADQLRMMQAAAEAREDRLQRHARAIAGGEALQVSEATPEEFEASQREWEATIPGELDGPAASGTPRDPG